MHLHHVEHFSRFAAIPASCRRLELIAEAIADTRPQDIAQPYKPSPPRSPVDYRRAVALPPRWHADSGYFGCGTGCGGEAAITSPGPGVVKWLIALSSPSLLPSLPIEVTL